MNLVLKVETTADCGRIQTTVGALVAVHALRHVLTFGVTTRCYQDIAAPSLAAAWSQRRPARAGSLRNGGRASWRGVARYGGGKSVALSGDTTERILRHLVGLKMPRALVVPQMTLAHIQQRQVSALEAIESPLGKE